MLKEVWSCLHVHAHIGAIMPACIHAQVGAIVPAHTCTHRRKHAHTSACMYAHISVNIFTFVCTQCVIMYARVWEVSDFCCSCNDEIWARTSCFSKPFKLSMLVHHLTHPKRLGITWLLHCSFLVVCAKNMVASSTRLIAATHTQAWWRVIYLIPGCDHEHHACTMDGVRMPSASESRNFMICLCCGLGCECSNHNNIS